MPGFVCIAVPPTLQDTPTDPALEAIKQSGFHEEIGAAWIELQPEFERFDNRINAINFALASTIQQHDSHFPIVFGCDCMPSLGIVRGLKPYDVGVVWFDAHGDFNTPETSPSGFIGGMPLAMLVGRGDQHLMEGIGLDPIQEPDAMLIDARNLDPLEADAVRNSRITYLRDIRDLPQATLPPRPLYVHFDVDVLDPSDFPALGYPEPNGPTFDEVLAALRYLAGSGRMSALLISGWDSQHPKADHERDLNTIFTLVRTVVNHLHVPRQPTLTEEES